jgi:hypothetical protein
MTSTRFIPLLLIFLLFIVGGCTEPAPPTALPEPTPTTVVTITVALQPSPTPVRDPGRLASTDAGATTALPAVANRMAIVAAAAQQPVPVLLLSGDLSPEQAMAQAIALDDAGFLQDSWAPGSAEPLRTEIFGIYPLRASDITEPTVACHNSACYRVEKYNYAYNHTVIAVVDLTVQQVLTVDYYPETQPDLPPHLVELAVEIAVHAPEVAEALGEKPGTDAATMANMKTALNQSLCERSRHLCVAPTFLQGERALWAVVDLTSFELVGVRWTDLGASQSPPVTEKTLQNEVIYAEFCEKSHALTRAGWELDYILTSSDGLRISDVRYQGKPVLDSAKLVDFHVSYSETDGFGYSDAVGCPIFSQAAVLAFEPPQVEELVENNVPVGFALTQDFRSELWPLPCNYRYGQRYEFYADGRFVIHAENLGRGCGNNGMYRPVLRIAPAGVHSFASWDGEKFVPWEEEQWVKQSAGSATTASDALYQIAAPDGEAYAIAPYWSHPERSSIAYFYVTKRHTTKDEGDADLITIGPCCNEDYRQGPEKFIEDGPEALAGSALVLWYVPELKNDDTPGDEYCWADYAVEDGVYVPVTWPCAAGLHFAPVAAPE